MLEGIRLPPGYEFHHLGYATTAIDRELRLFRFLGYEPEGDAFSDPVQGIAGRFLRGPGPRVELLENLPGSDKLTPWLTAGIKLYHFGYQVDSIEVAVEWARGQRAKVVSPAVPAVAFGGRRITFIMFPNGLLLEFIEHGPNHGSVASAAASDREAMHEQG